MREKRASKRNPRHSVMRNRIPKATKSVGTHRRNSKCQGNHSNVATGRRSILFTEVYVTAEKVRLHIILYILKRLFKKGISKVNLSLHSLNFYISNKYTLLIVSMWVSGTYI